MANVLGTIRLWVDHNIGGIVGLRLTEEDRIFRAVSSLPVYGSFDDGRELTHGIQTDRCGIIHRAESGPLPREPDWTSEMRQISRRDYRRRYFIEVLQDTGKLLCQAETIARQVLNFYGATLSRRAEPEPQIGDSDTKLIETVGRRICSGVFLSPIVRDRLMRLVLEHVNIQLKRKDRPLGWNALAQSARMRELAYGSGETIPPPWRLAREPLEQEAEAQRQSDLQGQPGCVGPSSQLNQSNQQNHSNDMGQLTPAIRLPLCDQWLKNFDTVLYWESVREIRDLCLRAEILMEERVRLGTALPLAALRAALQGDQISSAEANTLLRWKRSLQAHRHTEEQWYPLINMLVEIFAIEGSMWRSCALIAETLARPEISMLHALPDQLSLQKGDRVVEVSVVNRWQEYHTYEETQGTDPEQNPQEFWVIPRASELDRCRLVVRQAGRHDDYPRPTHWKQIPQGGWHVRGCLIAFSKLQQNIRNPTSIDAILASDAWMAQVDSWHSGRSLPHAFVPEEMFCEIEGGRSRLVWLTPLSPVPFSGEAWESLLQRIFEWMGEQSYLNMTARMGWGHARDTETLRHIVGILLTDPSRVGHVLEEISPHVPEPWASWVKKALPMIKEAVDEGMELGIRRLMDQYIQLNVHGGYDEVRERLGAAALEQIRLYGPAICFLPHAFRRAVIEVAKATQAELRSPLSEIEPLFQKAAKGLDPCSTEFIEMVESCGIACEGDLRNVQQLFRVLFCNTPAHRYLVGEILQSNLSLLIRSPARIRELVTAKEPGFPEKVFILLERSLILLSRHVLTQPNEAAVAARAWETAV